MKSINNTHVRHTTLFYVIFCQQTYTYASIPLDVTITEDDKTIQDYIYERLCHIISNIHIHTMDTNPVDLVLHSVAALPAI